MKCFTNKFTLICALFALSGASLPALDIQFLQGFEGAIREPDGNEDQGWTGLEIVSGNALFAGLHPYGKVMLGWNDTDYLVTAGLEYKACPFASLPELCLGLQTGPAYTNAGPPHTGSKWNWTTDAFVRYHWLQVGYSHTSNGGIDAPNSGLDMVVIGVVLELD